MLQRPHLKKVCLIKNKLVIEKITFVVVSFVWKTYKFSHRAASTKNKYEKIYIFFYPERSENVANYFMESECIRTYDRLIEEDTG